MLIVNTENAKTALKFVEAVNSHNLKLISSLMTEEHKFIDSLGKSVKGKKAMTISWGKYFEMFPDYFIRINEIIEKENLVVLIGFAKLSFNESLTKRKTKQIKVHAVWSAKIKNSLVAEWRIYADNSAVTKLMQKHNISFNE